jgi:hypothetical protein
MKRIIANFLVGLGIMIGMTFTLGLNDDAFKPTGAWYNRMIETVEYYFFWVLPYWWMIIFLGAIGIAVVASASRAIMALKINSKDR